MKKAFLFFITMCASTLSAHPFESTYVNGFAGINFVESLENPRGRVDWDSGYVLGASLGHRFSNCFRLEAEVAYRSNNFYQLIFDDIALPMTGRLRNVTVMANGLVELHFSHSI